MLQRTLDGGEYIEPIPTHEQFTGLYRILNKKKRDEISEKLSNPDPSHYERLWMVGYLLSCGWTGIEIYNLIACENEWDHYDDNMTYNQVMGIERNWRRKRAQK